MVSFSLSRSESSGRCVVAVAGEIDLATAGHVADMGIFSLGECDVEELVIDLSAVSFLDSTGLGALVTVRNAAFAADKSLVLSRPSERVRRTLEISALDTVFTIESAMPDSARETASPGLPAG